MFDADMFVICIFDKKPHCIMTLLIFYVQLGTGNIKHMSLISLAVKTINSTVVQISSIFLFEDIQTLIYNLAYLQCVT